MKIYTKKGDTGTTSLLGGTRVAKHDLRLEAYGTVDELNAHLGMLADQPASADFIASLHAIQHHLFTIGSHLANDPEKSKFVLPPLPETAVSELETQIDEMEKELPELKNFILPGGHPANSLSHICRTVCRRAERRSSELAQQTTVDPGILRYLNRLSDWLFVLGRVITHQTGSPEIIWKP